MEYGLAQRKSKTIKIKETVVDDIKLEDIMVGLSVCRNQNLANIFYRLKLIETYGTGIRKIMNAYQNTGKNLISKQPITHLRLRCQT